MRSSDLRWRMLPVETVLFGARSRQRQAEIFLCAVKMAMMFPPRPA